MRSSIVSTIAAGVCAALMLPACAAGRKHAGGASEHPARDVVRYNGASVEGKVERALQLAPPVPLEDAEERDRRIRQLQLEAAPCDLQVESVPHGIRMTFFAREGGNLDAEGIREQVQLIVRVHNRLFAVPEMPEQVPETSPLVLDHRRPDHSPLRALMAIPSRASWEPTPRGARLVLTTGDPRDLEDLRAHVRWHAPELLPELMSESKRCPDVPADVRAHFRAR